MPVTNTQTRGGKTTSREQRDIFEQGRTAYPEARRETTQDTSVESPLPPPQPPSPPPPTRQQQQHRPTTCPQDRSAVFHHAWGGGGGRHQQDHSSKAKHIHTTPHHQQHSHALTITRHLACCACPVVVPSGAHTIKERTVCGPFQSHEGDSDNPSPDERALGASCLPGMMIYGASSLLDGRGCCATNKCTCTLITGYAYASL